MDGFALALILELGKLLGLLVAYPFVPTKFYVDNVQVSAARLKRNVPSPSGPGFSIVAPSGDNWYSITPATVLDAQAAVFLVKDPQSAKYARGEDLGRTRTDVVVAAIMETGADRAATVEALARARIAVPEGANVEQLDAHVERDQGAVECSSYWAVWLERVSGANRLLRRETRGRYCAHPGCPAVVLHAYSSFRTPVGSRQSMSKHEVDLSLQSLRFDRDQPQCWASAGAPQLPAVMALRTPPSAAATSPVAVTPPAFVPPSVEMPKTDVAPEPLAPFTGLETRTRMLAGDHVRVLTRKGEWLGGTYQGISGSTLTLNRDGRSLVLNADEIWEMWWKGHRARPIRKGAVAGAITGAVLGALLWAATKNCGGSDSSCAVEDRMTGSDVAAMATTFSVVGAGIGALITHQPGQLVYARPHVGSATSAPRASIGYTVRF